MTGEIQRGNAKEIDAEIPLAEMFGYVTDLRSITQGRGNFQMTFSHYGEVPRFVQDDLGNRAGSAHSSVLYLGKLLGTSQSQYST